jgi:aryl-alcohol dehydrogenase-like predicted oxidoreductase
MVSAGLSGRTVRAQDLHQRALALLPLIKRRIPSTGELLPAIGIGTNNFESAHYDELRAVLERQHKLGGAVIDTSDDYNDAEVVIGRALAELHIRKKMFIVTKFEAEGHLPSYIPPQFLDKIFGEASFTRSLQRLQVQRVDLLIDHHMLGLEPLMPLMLKYKREGKARYIGVSTEHEFEHQELAEKLRQYPLDFVQVDYSIANRDAENNVLPAALERKIAVMVDIPLGSRHGPLVQKLAGHPLPPWARDIDVLSWSQFLLKYVVSHPAVTCAIPGTTNIEHVTDNQLACRGRLPDARMRKRMEDYFGSLRLDTDPPPAAPK